MKPCLRNALFACAALLSAVLLGGCTHAKPAHILGVYLESPDDGTKFGRPCMKIKMPLTGNEYYVYQKPMILSGEIVNIELVQVEIGLCIRLDLEPHAAFVMQAQTSANQGGRLFFMVDKKPVGVRLIDAPILGSQLYMFLEMSDDELPEYVLELRESVRRTQVIRHG